MVKFVMKKVVKLVVKKVVKLVSRSKKVSRVNSFFIIVIGFGFGLFVYLNCREG